MTVRTDRFNDLYRSSCSMAHNIADNVLADITLTVVGSETVAVQPDARTAPAGSHRSDGGAQRRVVDLLESGQACEAA